MIWAIIGGDKLGQTLGTAQSEVGGVLIGILGIALLWKGSRAKGIPKRPHTNQ